MVEQYILILLADVRDYIEAVLIENNLTGVN